MLDVMKYPLLAGLHKPKPSLTRVDSDPREEGMLEVVQLYLRGEGTGRTARGCVLLRA